MISELQKYLLYKWESLGIPIARPSNLSFMERGSVGHYPGNILFLIFDKEKGTPLLFAKVSRLQDGNSLLEREYRNLLYLNALCSGMVRNSIPTPFFYGDVAGFKILLTNSFIGKSLNIFFLRDLLLPKSTVTNNSMTAIRWMEQFHKETMARKFLNTEDLEQLFLEPLQLLRGTFDFSQKEETFIDSMTMSLETLSKTQKVTFFRQGRFTPNNILVSNKGELGIIDWESSMLGGLPLHDILFFFIDYGFCRFLRDETGKIDKFRRNFFSGNWYSSLVRKLTLGYCQKLGIESDCIPFYFFMMLVNMANKEYEDLCCNRSFGYMGIHKGFSKPIAAPSREILKDGLYINMLRVFMANLNDFIFNGNCSRG